MSPRPRTQMTALEERFQLVPAAAPALGTLLGLLETDPFAPTTVVDAAVAIDAHVADALVALELDPIRSAHRIADIGSGAGVPGLVLAAALPDARVDLVESNGRKCAFIEGAADAMGLTNVDVVRARAEEWSAGVGVIDAVTVRAVAPLNVLVEYASPLLVLGGALVAWKGQRDAEEEADGAAAAAATGLSPVEVRPVHPWDGAEHLHLHVYAKVASTPKRYPRRAGMASKRPLRAAS